MNYLLLKNGFVVSPHSIKKEDILVGGNKILEIAPNLKRPTSETPVIDASDKYIMPGIIDINRSFLEFIKCQSDTEEILRLNQAQMYNGTTMMIDSIEDNPKKDYQKNIEAAKKRGSQNSIDFSFHLKFNKLKNITTDIIDNSYLHEGISSLTINIGSLYAVSEEVIQNILSGILNNDLLLVCDLSINHNKEEKSSELYSTITIEDHFQTLNMLINVGVSYGCSIMFTNILFVEEYNLIYGGIERKADFYGSLILPFNIGETQKVNGLSNRNYLFKDATNKLTFLSEEAVWQIINSNRFIIASPPFNLQSSKDVSGGLVYNRPDRYHYLRNYQSVLFTSGVNQKQISIQKLSNITSTLPAKLMGVYPQKGILAIGSDADIVVWNPDFDRNLYCTLPSAEANHNEYKLKGRCDFVFLKGQMVYNGELFDSRKTSGSFIFRTSLEPLNLE
ncbi:amidohydrolase family protein [Saccharicrinis aurantiacus]|uniref:amidohydrolase family protein n=1 Tax=Saccharicrinis aurantiacus TaxID=1849719 RepID=UPI0024925596|nr:amidohydrolase family protein [Saccharicrinis aurantiacus]